MRCFILSFLLLAAAEAQQNTPHVGYVYPAGGRQGATVEVTAGGQFLDGAATVMVSGSGVEARVVEYLKPLTQGQFNRLRDQLQELMDKRKSAPSKWTAADDKMVAEIRQKMATIIRRPVAPQIIERVRMEVKIADNAPPGRREIRLGTALGLTNPLAFYVGQLPEYSKPPAEPVDELTLARVARFRPPDAAADGPTRITLPAILNGQIRSGTVEKYRFPADKGMHLVISAGARQLIPYISDAVPGWFQAALALYDAAGKEVAYADHYTFHQDPVLYYEIPSEGEYTLEIKDSIYRGREDFVYRITLGQLPFVTAMYPLGGKAGGKTNVELAGWNLPKTKLALKKGQLPEVAHALHEPPFSVDTLPEAMEKEPNNTVKNAQRVKLPVIVNGRIQQPDDWDVFRFEGRAGEEIVAEVLARRLDSPLDSILKLTDSAGKELAINDDTDDKAAGMLTHQADSLLRLKLPANGTYYVYLGDTQHQGGREYAYRLRISHPRPDYELRVVPASLNVRSGTTVPVTVYALRRDGFNGEIALHLKDAAAGFMLSGAAVPSDQDKVRLTLTVPSGRKDNPFKLHLEGQAVVQAREVRRPALPAEDMMQAFYYHHLIPSADWMVRVVGAARLNAGWKPMEKRVQVPAGGSAPVEIFVPRGRMAGSVQMALNEPPEGIEIQSIAPVRDGFSILLHASKDKIKPGLKGNLIVDAYLERAGSPGTLAKRRLPLATLPAIPFEIVAQSEPRP